MKRITINILFAFSFGILLTACGGGTEKGTASESEETEASSVSESAESVSQKGEEESKYIVENPKQYKGIGPVESLELPDEIDQALAKEGEEIYNQMCTACHKPYEKLIGPAAAGIMDRRSPEWIMNMILNPQEMLEKDPIAKKLLKEYNGVIMANQNLTRDQARKILEYFRTLDKA